MGHSNTEVVTSHEDTMTNIQRAPTIPMTKRDSRLTNGNRVSLLANGTMSPVQRNFEEKDYLNTNPNMVAGKKRSPKVTEKLKRTDSYKIATNRQSVDDLDGLTKLSLTTDTKGDSGARGPRAGDRTKYNTLPRTDTVIAQKKASEPKRKRLESGKSHGGFDRNASQKSGTYPSPDTDEDQRAIKPDRKKKSTFKRMKERLILTFKKDSANEEDKKKKKGDKYKSPSRVKPNHLTTRHAFKAGDKDLDIEHDNRNGQSHAFTDGVAPSTKERSAFERNHKTAEFTNGDLNVQGGDTTSHPKKSTGILRAIRESFRRKQAPSKFQKGKGFRNNNEEQQGTGSSSQTQSGSSLQRENKASNNSNGQRSQHSGVSKPIDINNSQGLTTAHVHNFGEHFIDTDDSITELFGSLIDPAGSVKSDSVTSNLGRPRPDTSKLRLEGLKKFKPRSFDRNSPREGLHHTSHAFVSDLSPTVEIDGFDYADAPTQGAVGSDQDESDLEYSDISQLEKQRRVDNVAKRLAAIGDSIVSRRESESAGSSEEVDSFRVGSQNRRLSQLEQELLTELRRYGDDIDGTLLSRGRGVTFSSSILPIIKGIISAQDYSTFKIVVQREISNTVGWEQVAWYTYIMKATMDLAGAGKTVGSIVKNHATHYFSTTLRPWIQSRPNGWESIHEETDVDSEVD